MMKRQRFSLPLMLSLMLGGVLYSLQPAQAQEIGQPNSDAGVTSTNVDNSFSGNPSTGGGATQGVPQITVQQTSNTMNRVTNRLENGEFAPSSPGSQNESPESGDSTAVTQPSGESESPSEPNQSEEAQANEMQQEQQQVPEKPEEDEENQMQQEQQQQPVRGLW